MRLMDLRSSSGSLVIANVRSEVSDTFNDVLGMWWRGRGGLTSKLRRRASDARALRADCTTNRGSPFHRATWSCAAIVSNSRRVRERLGTPRVRIGFP